MTYEEGGKHLALRPVAETTGRNVVSLDTRPPVVDDRESIEEISRMTEISRLSYAEMDDLGMIYPGMRRALALNAFRELRTNLYQATADRQNFVLLVSSIVPGGGASFVSLNLGAAIAMDESRTSIIVDCNIYEPSLQRLLPVEPDFGLVDYLENVSLEIKDVIYGTGVRRLRLIPAGSRRTPGTEFFTSTRMRRFVDELRSRYRDRNVILDAPPLATSADARILAEVADFVVLVVPSGRVTDSQLRTTLDVLPKSKLLGVVFNQ
jgi:exopolysaccharide/PEP-CTERM locus tyrosine autokinase